MLLLGSAEHRATIQHPRGERPGIADVPAGVESPVVRPLAVGRDLEMVARPGQRHAVVRAQALVPRQVGVVRALEHEVVDVGELDR